MNVSSMLRTQWSGYSGYHQWRANLLLHIVLVPLFIGSNVTLLIALAEHRWLLALGALALTGLSLAIQGRGHSKEPVPAQPFTGPVNTVSLIVLEQWVSFPPFVLTGGSMQALGKGSTHRRQT